MSRSSIISIGPLILMLACGSDPSTGGDAAADAADAAADTAADAAGIDTGAVSDAATSADSRDDAAPDTAAEEVDAAPGPGEFGAPCVGNGDCLSGYCVEGPSGYICTRQCDDTCPDGFDCRSIPGRADVSFVCVPRLRKHCTPCSDDLQCGDGVCLAQDGAGACAATCAVADDCPVGFSCLADPTGRAPAAYCQPDTGSCTCSAVNDLGERACSVRTDDGVCFGVERCDAAVGWGECSAKSPGAEACNGVDDDCDGAIDDGLVAGEPCDVVVEGVGACPGTSRCAGTPGWVCDGPRPALEACNGLDDDCDDAADEDFKDDAGAWTLDTHCGRCNNDCTTRFANGVGRCGGTAESPGCVVERCDDGYILLDNQCIEPIDATCQPCDDDDACYGGSCLAFESAATVCLMPCAAGTGACPSGMTCTTFGALERCAPTSGSCACTPGLAGNQRTCSRDNAAGRCFGVEVCQDEAWSECSAATPVAETCNGADDDCDGQLDEDVEPPLCPLQAGVCAGARAVCAGVSGFLACNAGSYGAGYEPSELTCDQLDNDCDGETDEVDLDADGHRPLACGGDDCNDDAPGVHPGLLEVCADQLDNDCDGSADNLDGDGDGFIATACGGLDCDDTNTAVNPDADEICGDAVDQDCTGQVDDKDLDGDGELDRACAGGLDCDDDDPDALSTGTEIWDAKDNDCDGLVDEDVIPAGSVVVTEIMIDASAASDAAGEYFEVKNVSASTIDLRSWVIADVTSGGDVFTVVAPVVLAPGTSAVLCKSGDTAANGGIDCDFVYGALMDLDDDSDRITLTLAGDVIDVVVFDERFPVVGGRAMSLDPVQTSRLGNDVHGNWCATPIAAQNLLANGDYGTPGRANPACSGDPDIDAVTPDSGIEHGGDVLTITGSGFIATTAVELGGTACASFEVIDDSELVCVTPAHAPGWVLLRVEKGAALATRPNAFRFTGEAVTKITWVDLQHPKTLTVQAGQASELIFGQVRAQGVTEPAGAPPGISGQVGYGPLASDPRITPGWRWFDAAWNKQFYDNDEFMATLTFPSAGTWSYAYRFTDDGGTSFMYGDFDPGTADGLTTDKLGTATVTEP